MCAHSSKDLPGDKHWMSQHNQYVIEAKKNHDCDILMIGDSIVYQLQFTNFYKNNAPKGKTILNFGIGGDKVENVSWRINDGDWLNNLKPKVLVLFVGTNNVNSTPMEINDLLDNLIQVIYKKTPLTQIVMPLLLPKGQFPNQWREKVCQTNDLIKARFNKEKNIYIIDMEKDKKITNNDGTISNTILHDYLHLSEKGYALTWKSVLKQCEVILNR
ncbi:platelet-activating factor acetylhydrolase IB subunit alpha2-like [Arctopsyche grandis]|uniref:platelet-activating factor acetylhydrolase IB subunit alpha2-like n=1 Tax=Arctopsyche grandis TaxID=121162 RepID=UPI00406D92E7